MQFGRTALLGAVRIIEYLLALLREEAANHRLVLLDLTAGRHAVHEEQIDKCYPAIDRLPDVFFG